jgi:hypothetical protein
VARLRKKPAGGGLGRVEQVVRVGGAPHRGPPCGSD